MRAREVEVPPLGLAGTLTLPPAPRGVVLFAHGSGSSRFSRRNRLVAAALQGRGFATLLFDLLLPEEEGDRAKVFDIALLADRLGTAVHWATNDPDLAALPIGLFGASTGAAAALVAAARLGDRIAAVVSRGGRPDLAGAALDRVVSPTLLIVGGEDGVVVDLNAEAFARLDRVKALEIVPGATHLFPEPGALEAVVEFAGDWFERHLVGARHRREAEP
ncbi:dienelactone hydrolase family protein [Pinisolibacter sp.]|uniref:dienelactone hydrolase family protein n=1 Tax=Pinisolibacter sp. TaxID=2172024 RepID=UPI002FDDA634